MNRVRTPSATCTRRSARAIAALRRVTASAGSVIGAVSGGCMPNASAAPEAMPSSNACRSAAVRARVSLRCARVAGSRKENTIEAVGAAAGAVAGAAMAEAKMHAASLLTFMVLRSVRRLFASGAHRTCSVVGDEDPDLDLGLQPMTGGLVLPTARLVRLRSWRRCVRCNLRSAVINPDLLATADFSDFDARELTLEGVARTVYVTGAGPAVIVMAEMPGISPHLLRFARWVVAAGFTVYLPSLFGRDGVVVTAEEGAETFRRLCVSAEFRALKGGETSPVSSWLQALARTAHAECGGPGVGAVGMCFTGNFALSIMLEPAVLAPVVSQPSLPLLEPGALEISDEDLDTIRKRLEREDLTVLGLRFEGDRICRRERFLAYSTALGDRFRGITLPDEAASDEQIPPFFVEHVPFPHSVLTVHLVDREGSPTTAARDEVIAFLRSRLLSEATDISPAGT